MLQRGPQRPRRQSLLAGALVGGCLALISTWAPAATAKRDGSRPLPPGLAAPREHGPQAPSRQADETVQATVRATTQPATAPSGTTPQPHGPSESHGGGALRHDSRIAQPAARHGRGAHGGRERQSGGGVTPAAAGSGATSSTPQDETTGSGHSSKGKAGKGGGGSMGSGATPATSSPTTATPTLTATVASAPAPAPSLTPTPAPTAAPVASTPTVVPPAAQAGGGRASRATRARGRRGGGGAGARGTPAAGGVKGVVIAGAAGGGALTAGTRTPAGRPAGGRTGAGRRSSSHSAQSSPLATTVTKIIDVVPLPVRIVIALLVALALALAANSRLIALRARRLARQRRQLLDDVGLLQTALLPALPERIGTVASSAAYRPASGPGAGGDFYDVFTLGDGRLGVIVGDVSGHGREALPQTTLVRFTLRAYLEAGLSPRSSVQAAAPVLERQLGDAFATVVLATYDPAHRMLVYACAGHPQPVVTGAETLSPITACSAPPIGVGQPTGTRQTVLSLPGRSQVCFYTDGVVEARVAGKLFGRRRLARALAELGPQVDASSLLDRVAQESDERPDDMAACVLGVEGEAKAPRVRVEELELDGRELARDRARSFLLAGGVSRGQVEEILASVRSAVARNGAVVLELDMSGEEPRVSLREQNVARLQPPAHEAASALGAAR